LSPRLLYLVPLYTVLIGWFGFAAIFLFERKRSRDQAKRIDRASIIGIVLQTLAFMLVWIIGRRPSRSILPLGLWFQFLIAMLVPVLVLGSLWLVSRAVSVLGKQWSLQARVLESHALVRQGPYRFVRHPIYTGMFGMLLAAGLAYSHWIGLLVALAIYCSGTAIRVRSEEKLLREQFGAAFDNYARNVPAVVPLKLRF